MNESMLAFVELVKGVAPYSISWVLGIRAYRFLVDAFTGRNARI